MNLMSTFSLGLYFKLIIWFSHIHSAVLRMSGGRLMHQLLGLNMLLLFTKGRRTGQTKTNPLLYVQDGNQYYCVASFGGNDRNPQWFRNLVANPKVQLLVKGRHITAMADVTSGKERCDAWKKLVNYYPPFSKYQRRTSRTIPVVKFHPLPNSEQ